MGFKNAGGGGFSKIVGTMENAGLAEPMVTATKMLTEAQAALSNMKNGFKQEAYAIKQKYEKENKKPEAIEVRPKPANKWVISGNDKSRGKITLAQPAEKLVIQTRVSRKHEKRKMIWSKAQSKDELVGIAHDWRPQTVSASKMVERRAMRWAAMTRKISECTQIKMGPQWPTEVEQVYGDHRKYHGIIWTCYSDG